MSATPKRSLSQGLESWKAPSVPIARIGREASLDCGAARTHTSREYAPDEVMAGSASEMVPAEAAAVPDRAPSIPRPTPSRQWLPEPATATAPKLADFPLDLPKLPARQSAREKS